MPTYEYECRDCGHRLERFQPMTAAPLRKCPECGGRLKRLIGTGAAVVVKGSGSAGPACGRDSPCCGRDTPCDSRPRDQ